MSNDNGNQRKLKLDKKHVQGFIAGALVVVLIIFSSMLVVNPSLLTGTSFLYEFPEFVNEADIPIVTKENFDTEVLKADKPVLVYFTFKDSRNVFLSYRLKDYAQRFDGYLKKYIVEYEGDFDSGDLVDTYNISGLLPVVVLFRDGRDIGYKVLYSGNVDEFVISTNAEYDRRQAWKNPTPQPTPTTVPTPTPETRSTIYRAFLSSGSDKVMDGATQYLGELCIFPYPDMWKDFAGDEFSAFRCDKDKTFPLKGNEALYSVLGDAYKSDDSTIKVPSLADKLPMDGIFLYMVYKGTYPRHDYNPKITINGIDYLPDYPEYSNYCPTTLGQIFLAKNFDEDRYSSISIPCDGRSLNINQNQALYSLLGTGFGGDGGSTFKLPNLSNVTPPVEGAKYYIIVQGVFPSFN